VSLPTPTVERIIAAVTEFNSENALVETALAELLRAFPQNTNPAHVLIKVVALNRLYSTNILAVETVAQHVATIRNLDQLLHEGSPEALDLISQVKIGDAIRFFFSFASKYCNWHNPTAYPILDENVDVCLWTYKNESGFAKYRRNDFYEGPMAARRGSFFKVISAFRKHYLESVTPKQLDKFLWKQGKLLKANALQKGAAAL
jgi:hypothetical protein